jgi:Glycosyl transferases group 1
MRIFWLFRSNLKHLEYYHKYDNLKEFEERCHDFYMLFPIWLLRNNYFDSVVIWRLANSPMKDIDFIVDGKLYSQRWVNDFSEVLKYPAPQMSFFRGGFQEYDNITKIKPKHFGLKIYLATGRRTYPQWGGIYDLFVQEDERDFRSDKKCLPFYKTASPKIFYPYIDFNSKEEQIKYDICWPCNFTQIRYKGQKGFIQEVSKNKDLQKLKIIHCGNKPEDGKKLCQEFGVKNIEFAGSVERPKLNQYLNESKLGLCLSNLQDGCPRVVTEILTSGTPLVVSNLTRVLPYYKKKGVIEVNQKNISGKIRGAIRDYRRLKFEAMQATLEELSFDKIMEKNIKSWINYL